MDIQRIIALAVFSLSGLFLWNAWQKHNAPPVVANTAITQAANNTPNNPDKGTISANVPAANGVPTPSSAIAGSATPNASSTPNAAPTASTKRVSIHTDTLHVAFDANSGDIRQVVLPKHLARGDATHEFTLMQEKVGHYFIAQSGLLGERLPNHTSNWRLETATKDDLINVGTDEKTDVVFSNTEAAGIIVNKTYTFKRGSYVVDVRYDIKTDATIQTTPPIVAKAYFQFVRDGNPPEGESTGSNPFTGVVTFTGPAVYTEAKKFQKIAFNEIEKNKTDFVKESSDGWMAMVQHYFVSAWLPQGAGGREFFAKRSADTNLFSTGVIVPVAATGNIASITMPLYLGPQEQENLKTLAPGLELVVDYGWLKVLAYPMFRVLSFINGIIGNWGWTIIIFTILLKLVFFPLNQKSGKSMAHMKTLMPKMEALKARYGDDKMKLNQAMMELYKTEKVNPLGGCLPIIIQIPFFISLYWVLLGAVELRNAPWILWINDLSTPDPLWVLPVVMGVTMFIQTKLNPAPADPIQAKVMTIMPIVFSIMFFFFPAGLVLYWTMQNILGIAQQWYINKTFGVGVVKTAVAKR